MAASICPTLRALASPNLPMIGGVDPSENSHLPPEALA